jgi:hypothetical protein
MRVQTGPLGNTTITASHDVIVASGGPAGCAAAATAAGALWRTPGWRIWTRGIRTEAYVSAILLAVAGHAAELHVSPNGDDANPGSADKPFKTINAAAQQAQAGDTVLVHAGTYRETVAPANSGVEGTPIVYRPFENAPVIISGAEVITGWSKDGDAWKAARPGDFYKSVYNYSDQVFADGTMLLQARWPNTPHDQLSYPQQATITTFLSKTRDQETRWTTAVFEDDVCPFETIGKNLVGAKMTLQPSYKAWSWTSTGTVEKTEATEAGGTRFTYKTRNDNGRDGKSEVYDVGAKYFVFDKKELLDAPGEWFHDTATGQLYVRLPGDADPTLGKVTVEARARDFAFNLSEKAYITVQGFELFACTLTTDDKACTGIGWQPDGRTNYPWRGSDGEHPLANHIVVDGVKARYVSHYNDQSGDFFMTFGFNTGIVMGGRDNLIQNCDIQYSAGNGISLYGLRNKALRNHIRDVSYNQQDCAGITTHGGALKSYDLEIGHNTITRTGRSGLTLRNLYNSTPGSGVTRIHHNDISQFMIQDHDGGGMYTFGIPSGFVRIDHNLVHDGYGSARGIYVDYGHEYVVDHNVIWNVQSPLYLLVSTNLMVYNNTLVDLHSGSDYQGLLFGVRDNNHGGVVQNNVGITQRPTIHGNDFYTWYIGKDVQVDSTNLRWDGRYGSDTDPRMADMLGHDYRPTAASPLYHKGSLVKDASFTREGKTTLVKAYNDPNDGAPNIGAYEGCAPAATAPGENLAAGKTVTASSSKEDEKEGLGAAKLTDGVINADKKAMSAGWRSSADLDRQHGEWVQIDLGAPTSFARVDLYPRNDGPTQPYGWDRGQIGRGLPEKLTVLASDGPEFKTGVKTLAAEDAVYERAHAWSYRFAPVTARYIRIFGEDLIPYPYERDRKNREYFMQLGEVQVFAESKPAPEIPFPGAKGD